VATAGDEAGEGDAGADRAIDASGPAPAPGSTPAPRDGRGLLAVLLVAVNLPILVATTRALARGWQPLGDQGILLVRARDVGTSHHPLLGTWTSASVVVGDQLNNPGPLYFDVIAPAVRLLGPWVGLAVGVMLVNMAASSLAVVAGRRIGGAEAGLQTMVAVAVAVIGLQYALGSELLFDVWQPNALVLPFFAFLVVVTVLATGDLAMAPWLAGLGSLLVQTHMSHAVIVAAVTLGAAALAALNLRHRHEWPAWRWPAIWTAVVLALAWIQPLIEQAAGPGEGNLSRIAGAARGGDVPAYGGRLAARLVAEVVTGPWFARSTYGGGIPTAASADELTRLPSFPVAVAVLALLLSVLAGLAVIAWRIARPRLATMVAVAAGALAAVIAALATSPVSIIGISAHQMRWVWPVTALVTAALLAVLLTVLQAQRALARPALTVAAAAVVAVAAVNLPTFRSPAGPSSDAGRLPQAQALVNQLDALPGRGPIRFDPTGLRYAEPFSGLVMAQLQDLGVPMVVDDEVLVRQLGEGRRDEGEARFSLREVEGPAAYDVPEGDERVAFVDGLSAAERAERRAIERRGQAGEPRPGDEARAAALDEKAQQGAVALFLEPIPED
jgi:hypothetical protein